jgi:hypothetical protein
MTNHFNENNWAKLSVFEQMDNIGSEVGRALNAKRRNDKLAMESAFYRDLGLIDYTAMLWAKSKSPRVKELLRARGVFASSILDDKKDPQIEKYFFQYALAAWRNK